MVGRVLLALFLLSSSAAADPVNIVPAGVITDDMDLYEDDTGASRTLVIENDDGGTVGTYMKIIAGTPETTTVILKGRCYSACTLYLTLPLACVHPKARLGFHAPTYVKTAPAYVKAGMAGFAKDMLAVYPPKIREWIAARGGLSRKWLVLKGRELHRLVTVCSPEQLRAAS